MDFSDDKRLVIEARTDPDAFGVLFDRYYGKIFGYTLRRVAHLQLAEDITAETFYKAYRKLWQFQWRNLPFSAWLYRIATNEINYYFRKQKLHKTISLEELQEKTGFSVPDPYDMAEEFNEAERRLSSHKVFLEIQQMVAVLPVKYQEVIALRFFESKKTGEIAKILGKKEGTVKSLLSRGLGLLRKAVQPSAAGCIMDSEGRIINPHPHETYEQE